MVPDVPTEVKALQTEITSQRRNRRLRDPDNQRLVNELGCHHDRGHLRRFLVDSRIEPTNHRAERALRPAVIARNVSQCSKTGRGTHAFEAFTRVVHTPTQQGIDALVEGLYHLFHCPSIQESVRPDPLSPPGPLTNNPAAKEPLMIIWRQRLKRTLMRRAYKQVIFFPI